MLQDKVLGSFITYTFLWLFCSDGFCHNILKIEKSLSKAYISAKMRLTKNGSVGKLLGLRY